MIRNMKSGVPTLLKSGSQSFKGINDTTLKSIDACIELGEIFQTSIGPNGLNKIIINHLDRISITSDTGYIIKDVEVNHPVAKMIVMAAKMQEKEIGDGSNFVMIFASELCRIAKEMIKEGAEMNEIIEGFSSAFEKSINILDKLIINNKNTLPSLIYSSMNTKCSSSAKLSNLVTKACTSILNDQKDNEKRSFLVDRIQISKQPGGNVSDSFLVNGIVVESDIENGEIGGTNVKGLKVVIFSGSIDTQITETKGVVLMKSADDLKNFNAGEEERIHKNIKVLKEKGVGLIITGGKIGDLAGHYLKKSNIIGLRIGSKFELKRIARLVKSGITQTFGEKLTDSSFGYLKSLKSVEIGLKKLTFLENDEKDANIKTIVVRGGTEHARDNAERAINDGINSVKTHSIDDRVIVGGGFVEIELFKRLSSFTETGYREFAEGLKIVPKMLAKSAAMDVEKTISSLIAKNCDPSKEKEYFGIDVENEKISNMKEKKVFELLNCKVNALRLATDVVCDLLRIDHIIMAKPAGGPKIGGRRGDWDED